MSAVAVFGGSCWGASARWGQMSYIRIVLPRRRKGSVGFSVDGGLAGGALICASSLGGVDNAAGACRRDSAGRR